MGLPISPAAVAVSLTAAAPSFLHLPDGGHDPGDLDLLQSDHPALTQLDSWHGDPCKS